MKPPGAEVRAETLSAGSSTGDVLWLDEPLSFWGGTDLTTGVITDVHHPQHGLPLAHRVLVMTASRGSSSSSSVLAEQIRLGVAPAAILLASRDAIVTLGALAAAEVYGIRLPILLLDAGALAALPRSGPVSVEAGQRASVSW
ncbi:aconitase X swivel domain-containing protein [Glaciibacter sp. 2TAF33]|uniref:aconitase X swivel domain-containing protein n=1 Tax=Glaciibacter sp. 2TAF33 TaxID=3233015 RepID=UPI003F8DE872